MKVFVERCVVKVVRYVILHFSKVCDYLSRVVVTPLLSCVHVCWRWLFAMVAKRNINTRTGEWFESHTVCRGHVMPNAHPSISAHMRAAPKIFEGSLGPHYNLFWQKFWYRGPTPFTSKGHISKLLTIVTEKNCLPVFPCQLGHYYSYAEFKKRNI